MATKRNGLSWDTLEDNSQAINGFKSSTRIEKFEGERKVANKSKKDEEGQIQDVIGHFGKYQFLIFVFKILIGVTSAYNNLSVTFFAPSDFISFKCLSPQHQQQQYASQLQQQQTNNNLQLAYNNSLHQDLLHKHNLDNPLLEQAANAIHTEPIGFIGPNSASNLNKHNDDFQYQYNNTQTTIPSPSVVLKKSTKHSSNENLFHDFVFGEERNKRHELGLNTDTPKNLVRECKYYSNVGMKNETCKSFQYDTGIWISTIIDEWDLVCDRSWFISMTQSLYMSGFIISFLVFGYISDRFGRWRSLLFGALIEVLSGFGCAFAPSVTSFMIFRFLLGIGNAGRSSTSYLIMIEWCGPKWRMHISTLGSLGWVIGYCSMPWITLYFLHFRHMQLFVCFYEVLFIIWLFWLPESPRWLLTHKRFDKAYEVLLMAAKFNGLIKRETNKTYHQHILPTTLSDIEMSNNNNNLQDLSSSNDSIGPIGTRKDNSTTVSNETMKLLKPMTIEQFDVKFKHLVGTIDAKDFTENENNLNVLDLFRWPNLRKYAFILYFVWASNSFIYYGIVLRVGDFGGTNLFKTFTIAGLTELPSIAFTIMCMKFMPRKTTNLFIFITTGLLCAIQLPLKYYDYQWLQQSSILLAKLFNSCSFTVVLYQTMELFPTSIRQTAYSSCSLAGRIGSILAPFVKELAQATNDSVPPIIYVVLSAIAALIIRHIPETKGIDMPDTLLEAEKMDSKGVATSGCCEKVSSSRGNSERID